jgi:SGNH domain (fused to AT3 domains)
VQRTAPSAVTVSVAAALLLGALAISLVAVGQPSAAGTGPLALPHPAPSSAVRYGEPPLKVLVVGDSMAGSLGVGLDELAGAYNVELANAGHPGCSLSIDGAFVITYRPFVNRPGPPCVIDHPAALLAAWQSWVDAFRPDVVVYLSRSDLLTQQVHGTWMHVGQRRFNSWYRSRLAAGIHVLDSRGARVVLATVPVSEEQAINARPQDNPVRVAQNGALLRMAAAAMPSTVSVYDLSQLLTPDFHFRATAQDRPLRCADGVHLSPDAGVIVAQDLFPRLWALASAHRVAGGGRWVHGPVPTTPPPWYQKLPCG